MNPLLGGQFHPGYHHNHHHHQQQQQHHDPYSGGAANRDTFTYEVWNNFFSSAGIPESVAHDYAVTFSQHRIKIDMLKEITKDILIDMGIKAMGDIIAILRHAKNLCTQDELKSLGSSSVTTKSSSSSNNNPATNLAPQPAPTMKHLSQRTPISTTSRSGSSVSALVGNKIQSRLNLSSGALVASSSSNNSGGVSTNQQSSKRHSSSSTSNSLVKRLRPAASDSDRSMHGNLPEKTLTVHYPSSSAIARAQQRISGSSAATTSSSAIPKTQNTPRASSSSIRSRLGNTIDGVSRLDNNSSTRRGSAQNPNSSRSTYTDNRNSDKGFQSNKRSHHNDNKAPPQRNSDARQQQTGRPKSTVFSRLGESTR